MGALAEYAGFTLESVQARRMLLYGTGGISLSRGTL